MSGSVLKAKHTTTETMRRGEFPRADMTTRYFFGDDWPRFTGERGDVFRPTVAEWRRWVREDGSMASHMSVRGVYVKKDGTEGRKTHYEFDTQVAADIFLAAQAEWGRSL